MPRTRVEKLQCPHCPYEPWSQQDLDDHLKFAHGERQHHKVAQEIAAAADTTTEIPPAPEPEAPEEKAEERPDPEKSDELPPGIFIPKPQPDFWLSEKVGRELYIVAKLSKKGEAVNLKVLGPAGVGKTTLGWEFAAANNRPCFEVHWGMYQEPGEVWGKDRLSMEQGTYYEQARYVDALETPNCVIILDEPNRCHPEILNTNFALWDWRRAAWVPDLQRMVRVAPGVVFFACMNEGGEYIGTNPMDRAIRERFTRTIRLSWPPKKVEAKVLRNRTGVDADTADKLARFARDVRRNPKVGCAPSTRQLLVAAQDVKEGLPINEAVLYSIINDLDENTDRTALLQHLQVIGKVDEAFVNGEQQEDDDD
jgi:nitric oxide reductase NorQ protein